MSKKKLNAAIGYLTRVIISCGLLMWSVFNVSLNVLEFRANDKPDQAWAITAALIVVTCVVPFLIGLWLLIQTFGKDQSLRDV